VATSDSLEQVIVMGQGAERVSADDFYDEVEMVNENIRQINEEKKRTGKNYLFDHMDEELADEMEQVRLGYKNLEEE
jgi:predicted RNA-binding protein with PIN domain